MNVQSPRLTSRLVLDRFQSAVQTVLILQASVLIFPVANAAFCDWETGDSLTKGRHDDSVINTSPTVFKVLLNAGAQQTVPCITIIVSLSRVA